MIAVNVTKERRSRAFEALESHASASLSKDPILRKEILSCSFFVKKKN